MTTSPLTPEFRRLFAELCALPPEQRTIRLDRCFPDPAARKEMEELLSADALTNGLIEGPVRAAAASLSGQAASLRLGAWRTTGRLGQGGMGVVYKAQRDGGAVEQTAAIKLLYRGLETEDLRNRFQRERTILARPTSPTCSMPGLPKTVCPDSPWSLSTVFRWTAIARSAVFRARRGSGCCFRSAPLCSMRTAT